MCGAGGLRGGVGQPRRAARSLAVSKRGNESGFPVRSSKNGFGLLRPSHHQPSSLDMRSTKIFDDGGGGALVGNGPVAERSKSRHNGAPSTSPRE